MLGIISTITVHPLGQRYPAVLLVTKLYTPPRRAALIPRPRLTERLDAGLGGRLTLVSAPAGFGKTTLVADWAAGCHRPLAWLSLDEADNEPGRFLVYLAAAVGTVIPGAGQGVIAALQSPQPPPAEALLTALSNEVAAADVAFVLVLDDYHAIHTAATDDALAFWLDHLPPSAHVVVITREDPRLPLPRLRARQQLTELRAPDLRFTPQEAANFFSQTMGLTLTPVDAARLESRTEGWVAGLQLAALSLQHHPDAGAFIESFSGSHRFILDYLIEEVLARQPLSVQTFLIRTAVLDRLTGGLCDALLGASELSGDEMLAHLERANLFIVPLDDERRWFRYHHLFRELLLQTLTRTMGASEVAALHARASRWFEANGLDAEAFQHAVASGDIDHTTRLVEGDGMPLIFRGVVAPVLMWLDGLPKPELDARPVLWVLYASAMLFDSKLAAAEPLLQAAEAALHGASDDGYSRDLIGHIASIRATVAVSQHDAETIMAQSQRALDYLSPGNLPVRAAATWSQGYGHHLRGDFAEAERAYMAAIAVSERIGHPIILLMATLGMGMVQEA
ncbi:MAG: LuxR family transcriptional regulator, partial [Anaerolineae bacterium]|nr:LuxR family transcriptional regulator [Anaerolineae bacterium]